MMALTKRKDKDKTKPAVPQILIMSPPRSSTGSSSFKSARSPRDTGFPEPFNGIRNTTRPHPDADTSPGACISHDDVSVESIKSRRHTLLMKHRRTVSSGKISPITEALRNSIPVAMADTGTEKRRHSKDGDHVVEVPHTPSTANGGSDSFERTRAQDSPATSFEDDDLNKRRSIFGKWRKGGSNIMT